MSPSQVGGNLGDSTCHLEQDRSLSGVSEHWPAPLNKSVPHYSRGDNTGTTFRNGLKSSYLENHHFRVSINDTVDFHPFAAVPISSSTWFSFTSCAPSQCGQSEAGWICFLLQNLIKKKKIKNLCPVKSQKLRNSPFPSSEKGFPNSTRSMNTTTICLAR